jgi:hypothetical protein
VGFVICFILLFLWLVASAFEMQRALQWWSKRQSVQLWDESERIRNGLLQDIFSVRRNLELALTNHVELPTQNNQAWLEKMEKIHHSLEKLSNHLSPPYIEESLPLALQSVAEQWRSQSSLFTINTQLPSSWEEEPPEQSRIIIKTLHELLKLSIAGVNAPTFTEIHLQSTPHWNELMVDLTYPDASTLTTTQGSQEIAYLGRSFRFLTSGWCFQQRQRLTVTWHFRWRHLPSDIYPVKP